MADFRQDLTDQIIEALESGTAPWQKPWDGSVVQAMQPFNPVSGTQYRGGNRLWLSMHGAEDPRWCTYKQAAAQGWQVRRGEKSTPIEFWKWSNEIERVNEETGEIEKVQVRRETPIVRFASVFNAAQMDNVPALDRVVGGYEWEPLQMAETIMNRSGVPFFFDTADKAYYRPSTDEIHMPAREAFPNASKFYAIALHEQGHATGHESRLKRDLTGRFGSEDYAKEELRAELASYFLSARLGIEFAIGNHASYVGSWIRALKEDKNEIFRASRDAELIAEYVMNIGLEKSLEQVTVQPVRGATVSVATAVPEILTSEKKTAPAIVDRIYLNVPYAEKEAAKKLGAKWDKQQSSWYVPEGLDKNAFGKWLGMPALPAIEFQAEFAAALRENKLIEDSPIMDGKWHRTTVSTSRNAKALKGAYIATLDGDAAHGFIQNFDTGVSQPWYPKGLVLSDERRQQFERQAEENRRVREAELQAERTAVAEKMNRKWDSLPEAVEHPYLARKGVEAFGLRLDGDRLVTPIRDTDGKLWSLQYISADPAKIKMYEKGGQKTGNFHLLGDIAAAPAVLFAEGYATAASLHMATGLSVVEVFDSNNMEAVVRTLKPKLEGKAMVLCGDDDALTAKRIRDSIATLVANEQNAALKLPLVGEWDIQLTGREVTMKGNADCKIVLDVEEVVPGVPRVVGVIENRVTQAKVNVIVNNVGREKATQAAIKHGAQTAFPHFDTLQAGQSDFNDLHQMQGLDEVRRQVGAAIDRALQGRTPEQLAKAVLGEHSTLQPAKDDQRYVGPVIVNTSRVSVQDTGRSTAVQHDLDKLDRVPTVGRPTHIAYEGARGIVSSALEKASATIER